MSLKLNTPNKNSYIVSNQTPYQFPQDGNDTEVVTRVQNQDIYSYEQNYFNGSDLFGNLSVTTMGPAYGSNQEWLGGVLAPNGTIYTTPYYPLPIHSLPPYYVLAVNTYTDVTRQILIPSSIPEPKGYIGGVCMPNGKIYRINNGVLIQDTNNDTFSYVPINYGSLTGGYAGCVLAQNGKIYGIPGTADNVIVFNPTNNSYNFITSSDVSTNGGRKWFGGVLAPNGNIYCFPRRNATSILVINTLNDTMTASIPTLGGFNINPSSEGPYWGGCLAQNGKIYGAPTNSYTGDISLGSFFIEIDPSSNTYKYVGNNQNPSGNITRKYSGPCLAQDGWIYCAGDGDNYVSIRFNPNTYQTETIGVGNRRFFATLGPNGKVYFPPRQANPFISVKTGYPQLQPWMMAPEFNKL